MNKKTHNPSSIDQCRRNLRGAALLMVALWLGGLSGCVTTGSTGFTHRVDPYAGRENQAAMSAVGALVRPHSKLNPAQTEQRIQGLQGLGVLMDLMGR